MEEFMQTFATNWRARWPHGLLLSSPDVPNRIPVPENGELNPLRQPQCRKLRMPAKSVCINKAIFHPRWSHCGLVPSGEVGCDAGSHGTGHRRRKFLCANRYREWLNARLFSLAQKDAVRHAGYRGECRLTAKPVTEELSVSSFRCSAAAFGFNLGALPGRTENCCVALWTDWLSGRRSRSES